MTYKPIVLSLIFLCLCSCTDSESSIQGFRDNHLNFHEQHIKFVERQKNIITKQLNRLVNDLDNNKEQEILIGNWDVLRDFVNEMTFKNVIYVENCISNDETFLSINEMNASTGKISNQIGPNEVDFKHYVFHGNYDQARAIIVEIQTVINKEMNTLYSESENYRKK